ncbi:unnamed protein product, partial [Rotaria sp. Silwood1]
NTNEKDLVVTAAAEDQNDFDNTLPMDTEPSTELTSKLDVSGSALSVQHNKGNNDGDVKSTPESWSIEQVAQWLSSIGLEGVTEQFMNAQYFNTEDYELLKRWSLYLCLPESVSQSSELDETFTTLVDTAIDEHTLVEQLIQNHSLKVYIIDSLKRYHSLMDIIHNLSLCTKLHLTSFGSQIQTRIQTFLDIIDTITKSILLITTTESMNYESQRYFGNFIKKNDLPVPFAYYIWNKEKNIVEYKINFNLLAETMCLTTTRYILQVGSESTIGMGLHTDGNSSLRNGCIDVIFPSDSANQNNGSYVIFDVHGTINALNEDIITSIQEYCALQILYVTEKDLKSTFLSSMMNYSQYTQAKPTLVIIFDLNYDNKHHQPEKLIDAFQLKYKNWKYVRWATAPPSTIWYQFDSNKKNKDLARSQRLQQSFHEITKSLDEEIQRHIYCTSIFFIQSYYLAVITSTNFNPPINCRVKIENRLDELFGGLDETKENLRIVTPVSYLDSEIKQCESDLSNNWDAPQTDLHNRRDDLIRQRSAITTIGTHTKFFVDLLTSGSYVELLITEKYLEKWRSRFEPTLHKQLAEAKMEASKLSSTIKQLEQVLSADEKPNPVHLLKIKEKLRNVRAEYEKQRTLVIQINKKLMHIDLTIGLFCDEIMALYDHLPRIFNSESVIQSLAKKLVNLMFKGFAIHILRGRPLRCDSKLIEECIKFIPTTQQPPLVLTVIGEQSSAKSSLMNTT